MRKQAVTAFASLVLLGFACALTVPGVLVRNVRQPAVAGSFYPQDREELQKTVDDLLGRASPAALEGPLVALIAPHAGYTYSGPVAAYSYAALKGRKFQRVVVIAPSHYESFAYSSVYNGDAYVTPLGTIPVDREFAGKLAKLKSSIELSGSGHIPSPDRKEHALEVQLPFLQRTLGKFELVPIVMGDQSYEKSRALGVALAQLIREDDTLIVASSDLSHFHPYDEATALDRKTLHALQDWDYLSLSRNFEARIWEACGGGPIVAAMIAAERLGANKAQLLTYANSGDVTSDRSRVVGYGAVALVRVPARPMSQPHEPSLQLSQQKQLLELARKSVETAVRESRRYDPPWPESQAFLQERSVFVTLRKGGELRGCIGDVSGAKPLYLAVRDAAVLAALRDPRFPPVTSDELRDLDYEISVLSPFRRVSDVEQIRIGPHGLLLKKGDNEGLLLPQVPTEQNWNRRTFLEQTALKAGLDPHDWQDADADLFFFSAQVFR
ncbi:MAG: AmmeMemoRadiSam system protein B [Terriglobales bacterium]